MSKTIDYYHFLISPWSYLAIKRFNALRQKHGLVVNYKPMDVMQTFDQMGGLPPAKRHPSRQRYRMAELKRWAAHLGVPINFTPAYVVDGELFWGQDRIDFLARHLGD